MKTQVKKPRPLRRRHLAPQARVLKQAWNEKMLKPVQDNIDAQRKFLLGSDALNNRIHHDRLRSLGMHPALAK